MECWALILGTVLGVAVMVVVMMMVPSWVAPWWGRLLLLWRLLWRWRWRFIVSGVAAVVGTASAAAVSVVVVAAAVAIASEAEEELFQSCFCSAVAIETSHTLLLCLKQMVDRFLFNFHTFLKKRAKLRPLFCFFLVFSNKQYNVHPVYGARIWIHNLSNMSHHSQPLDQGSCLSLFNVWSCR